MSSRVMPHRKLPSAASRPEALLSPTYWIVVGQEDDVCPLDLTATAFARIPADLNALLGGEDTLRNQLPDIMR
jgi:hypothetical protein